LLERLKIGISRNATSQIHGFAKPFCANCRSRGSRCSRETLARSCRCVSLAAIVSRIIRRGRSIAPSKGRPLLPALCQRDHQVMRLAPFALFSSFFYFSSSFLFAVFHYVRSDPSIKSSFYFLSRSYSTRDDIVRLAISSHWRLLLNHFHIALSCFPLRARRSSFRFIQFIRFGPIHAFTPHKTYLEKLGIVLTCHSTRDLILRKKFANSCDILSFRD